MGGRIAIVGAGAKAAAIVARAATLRALGIAGVPDIQVFEADHIGAAWSGRGRFSSGYLTLCTPGEKDVGFPYDEIAPWGAATQPIAPALFARFSWPAYLVATGRVSEWVDRGRHHPTHRGWASYLEWVFDSAGQAVTQAAVTAIRPAGARWDVAFDQRGKAGTLRVDGVVLTGTGRAKLVPCLPGVPADRALDASTFWAAREPILKLEQGVVAVAGDGGAAGTIVAWLADRLAERAVRIIGINPMGTLFPRGDGHAERRWFSDPSEWRDLRIEHRRELMQRTEAGVVSLRNKRLIDLSPKIEYRRGKAVEARWAENEVVAEVEYDGRREKPVRADYLVSAIGFDAWSLLELVDHPAVAQLCAPGGEALRRQAEIEMLRELSLPPISGLPPGLHVPALAGLAHGPGMGNLGCLGLMAASVLRPYLSK